MTGLEKLVEHCKERIDKLTRIGCGFEAEAEMWASVINKARALLAEEAKEKPPLMSIDTKTGEIKPVASAGLVEELREWAIGCHSVDEDGWAERCPGLAKFDEILSRHRPSVQDEPLAVLADRKGYCVACIANNPVYGGPWWVQLRRKGGELKLKTFPAVTYHAAEAAARQYLMSLPDKGEGK